MNEDEITKNKFFSREWQAGKQSVIS